MSRGFAVTTGARIPHPEPRPDMILGMHFDNSLVDEAGLSTFGGTFGYTTGKFAQGFLGANKVIYSAGLPVLNLGTEWRIQGWFVLNAISSLTFPAGILSMGDAGVGMASGGPGGATRQLRIRVEVNDPVNGGILQVTTVDESGAGENHLLSSQPPVSSIFGGILYWFCVGCDGTNLRLYLGENGDTDAVLVDELLNEQSYSASDFTNQCFVIGASYAGGGWPGIHVAFVDGMLDDIVCYAGPNAMKDRDGPTIPMPTSAFANPA